MQEGPRVGLSIAVAMTVSRSTVALFKSSTQIQYGPTQARCLLSPQVGECNAPTTVSLHLCLGQSPGACNCERHTNNGSYAYLLGEQHQCQRGRVLLGVLGGRQSQKQQQNRHAYTVIQTAFEIEPFSNTPRNGFIGDDRLAKCCIGSSQHGSENSDFKKSKFVKH